MLKPASFLDRDGVINIDKGYVHKIEDFEWVLGAKEAIKYLKELNFIVIVVTNQSGISRKYYKEKDVHNLHNFINIELSKMGTKIDDFYYSPFHPDVFNPNFSHLSHLRKPNTGMLELAEQKWTIDKSKSFMIGDRLSDKQCAKKSKLFFEFSKGNFYFQVKKILTKI